MDHSGHNMEEGAVMNDPVSMETTTTGHSEHTTGGDNGGHDMTMSMAMTFQAGYKQVILFDIWKTETVGAMIGAVAIVFVLAALYEGLKVFREHLLIQAQSRIATSVPVQPTSVRKEQDGSVIFLNNESSSENDITTSDGRVLNVAHWMIAYEELPISILVSCKLLGKNYLFQRHKG
ncbi:PREDICTED: uncharacterized protein LOC106817083 isoform X2 [Priapulus caudatus]|uniref:Copper transport protein n=1 Tax=Priapulus caudatus TaxID=37621 RepID=A0ABM1EYE6_PRICU|nr:PREDICTED: uncharacterized protein LOC106817083 isoform X2 [Priapulus caudatus]